MTELSYFPFFQRIHMKIIQKTFPAYSFYLPNSRFQNDFFSGTESFCFTVSSGVSSFVSVFEGFSSGVSSSATSFVDVSLTESHGYNCVISISH